MIEREQIGWLAGIIDGEGTICCNRNTRHDNGSLVVSFRVSVQNTSRAMVEEIARICRESGIVHHIGKPKWQPLSTKPVYRIDVWRKSDVIALLSVIRPFLIAKQTQADLVMKWITRWPDCRGKGKVVPTEAEKETFISALSGTNAA